MEFGWESLYLLPYSPGLVSTDYHMFHGMNNFLKGKIFDDLDYVKIAIQDSIPNVRIFTDMRFFSYQIDDKRS